MFFDSLQRQRLASTFDRHSRLQEDELNDALDRFSALFLIAVIS
jgi:hypothetical protein